MLRASSEVHGEAIDLQAVKDATRDSGVAHGAALVGFADAVVGGDAAALEAARNALVEAMGPAAMVDAAGVASNFERMVRIADSTGIPLGETMEEAYGDVREPLGLEALRAHRETG